MIIGSVKKTIVLKPFLRVIISALNAVFVIQKLGILKNNRRDLIEPYIALETLSITAETVDVFNNRSVF